MPVPDWVSALLERHRSDERRHLAYIEDTIGRRVWDIVRHA